MNKREASPLIIGLMGPAGAGKSTVAEHLVDDLWATRYSFAGPLKEIARRTLDLTSEQVYGTQAQKEAVDPRYGFSPRWFLQRLGTEGVRSVLGDTFWTEHCLQRIRESSDSKPAIIDDVRFPNEASAIQAQRNGKVILLLPPGHDGPTDSHASETRYLNAPYDAIVQPQAWGVPHLLKLVDDVIDGWAKAATRDIGGDYTYNDAKRHRGEA